MSFKIGFTAENKDNTQVVVPENTEVTTQPKKSVVQVYFPERGTQYPYYNDAFDLNVGDIVYVDGKLEGLRGVVVEVLYTFKIKLSDYKRVIARADMSVKGELNIVYSHLVAFDPQVLPFEKILTWYKAPANPDDEVVSSQDDEKFNLNDLSTLNISSEVANRGREYFLRNRVVYVCVEGTHGKAIVEGSEPYEVEFAYNNGEISSLVCSCYCTYTCKHQFAAMLQLDSLLKQIEKNYPQQYKDSNYFAAISKKELFAVVIDTMEQGQLILR